MTVANAKSIKSESKLRHEVKRFVFKTKLNNWWAIAGFKIYNYDIQISLFPLNQTNHENQHRHAIGIDRLFKV